MYNIYVEILCHFTLLCIWFYFEYMQEILDELADIDLVVNFKCTDNFFRKREGSIFDHFK